MSNSSTINNNNIFKKSANDNFTIENIVKWHEDIDKQLKEDDNYALKLRNDNILQRDIEKQWIDSDADSSMRLPFNNNKTSSNLIYAYPEANFLSTKTFLNDVLAATADALTSSMFSNSFDVVYLPSPLNSEIVHEINCRLNSLNSLRISIPNFQYLYGYGEETTAKKKEQRQMFMLYEKNSNNIVRRFDNDILMTDEKCTFREFCCLFLQIMFALKIASDTVGFTHYNLSPSSIQLILPDGIAEGDEFFIPYNTEGVRANIRSPYIAQFINLENAHVKCKNNLKRDISFGCPKDDNSISKCVYRDRPNVMTDVYRFLITSYKIRKEYLIKIGKSEKVATDNIVMYCIETLKFFNSTDSIDSIIENDKTSSLNFPITHFTRVFSMSDFINFAKRQIPKSLVKDSKKGRVFCFKIPANSLVLLYGSGVISGNGQHVTKIESDDDFFCTYSDNTPLSFEHFYDLYNFFLDEKFDYEVKTLATKFIQGFSNSKSMLNHCLEDLKVKSHDLINRIKINKGNKSLDYINLLRQYQNINIKMRIFKMLMNIYWKNSAATEAAVRSKSVSITESDRERSVSTAKAHIPKIILENEIEILSNIKNIISLLNDVDKAIGPATGNTQLLNFKKELNL